jgi:hypothetical protein
MAKAKSNHSPKSARVRSAMNNGPTTAAAPSRQSHLSQYADQRILTFKSPKGLDAAIDLLWSDALRNLPHDTPDGKALVVPAEAVAYFERAGLRLTERRALSVSDLSADEIRRLRG